MVAAVDKTLGQSDELLPFHFCCVLPTSPTESLGYDVSCNISKERMAKIVAALNILLEQRPGEVTIYGEDSVVEFKHKSQASCLKS